MSNLRYWIQDLRSRRREYVTRWSRWWHRYAGSVAFVALIIVTSIGFWHANENIKRLEIAELTIRQERDARIVALLYERDERVAAHLEQQAALTRYEARIARELSTTQLQVIRQANYDGCLRDNQLRIRLRSSVAAQIELTRSMGISALSRLSTVREFVEIMNRQENALIRLYNELDRVDCEVAFPPIVDTVRDTVRMR